MVYYCCEVGELSAFRFSRKKGMCRGEMIRVKLLTWGLRIILRPRGCGCAFSTLALCAVSGI